MRDFFVVGPPVWAVYLGNTVADDLLGRLYVIEAAGVGPQEPGLVLDGQLALLHGLDGPPDVVAVVVVHVGCPGQDVAVEVWQTGRRRLVALEAGDAVLEEGLAGQALQRREPSVIAVEAVGLVALVQQEAQPRDEASNTAALIPGCRSKKPDISTMDTHRAASAWKFCTLDRKVWGRPEVEMVFLTNSAPEYWSA